jgi:hypothetical protein
MRNKFKLYREDEKPVFAPVISIGQRYGYFRSPGVPLVERDINYVYVPKSSFEPLIQKRFLMTFPNEFNIPEYFVRNVTSPSCSYENGQYRWDNIIVNFYDPVHPSIQERLYNIVTNLNSRGMNYEFKIEILSPIGGIVQKWLINGHVNSIDIFDSLSYDSDLPTESKMSMSITVNNLVLE